MNRSKEEDVNKSGTSVNKMENTDNIESKGEVNRTFLGDNEKTVEPGSDVQSQTKNENPDEKANSLENGGDSKENVGITENCLKSNERGVDVEMFENGDEGKARRDDKKTVKSDENDENDENKKARLEGAEERICGRKSPQWLSRVRKDLARKQFIPLKVLFFLLFGAMMCLFPFLTLQARSLGITEKELSLLFALNPIVAFIGPPITGILADKIGNFKLLLSVLMGSSGAVALMYLLVPEARRVVPLPSLLPYTLTTNTQALPDLSHAPTLTLAYPHVCHYHPAVTNFTVTIANCTYCDGRDGVVTIGDDGVVEVKVMRQGSDHNVSLLLTAWPPSLTTHSETTDVQEPPSSSSDDGDGCVVMCYGDVSSEGLCTNTNTTQEFSPSATFFSYMAIRLLNGVTLATSFTMFQGATMAILRQYKGDLGLQRLYGNLGGIVMTPISGLLIDVFSGISGRQDFRPAFFLYFALKVVGALVILTMDLDFRMPSDKVTKDFKALLKNAEVITFLVVMLITGAFFGLLDTFLFWLLQDLGAKKSLMGITVTVGTSAGIPVLVASGYIIRRLGHANTIILGLAFYVIRMIGYSFLNNPWWCMPFEVLECFTVSLLGVASSAYADDLATPATIATLQGMHGGIHHGVGRALGSLVGGFMIAPLGIRVTFRIAAGVSAVTCVIYFVANRFFFRNQQEERRKAKELKILEGKEEVCGDNDIMKNIGMDVGRDAEKNKTDDKDVECDDVRERNDGRESDVSEKMNEFATNTKNINAKNNLGDSKAVTKLPNNDSNTLDNRLDGSSKNISKIEETLDANGKVGVSKFGDRECHNPAFEKD